MTRETDSTVQSKSGKIDVILCKLMAVTLLPRTCCCHRAELDFICNPVKYWFDFKMYFSCYNIDVKGN